ncbi:MAG: S8 family peptidase [Bacteroidales bacterium]|nr:S8 family peptidase [Bacteroidales bacterium]MDT8373566.1 S8 family peptidase [Bacteroidales bacterium]
MKSLLIKLFAITLVMASLVSCEDTLIPDQEPDDLLLKSAGIEKITYIVVLDDAEIIAELSKLKGYEKKQELMKSASAKVLRRAGVLDGEMGFVYGTALQGFSVKMPPGQLKKLETDPSVKYIERNQVATLIQPDVKIKKKPVPTPPAQSLPWGVDRVNGGVDGTGLTAWIIDTGIDLDHPDLTVDASRGATFVGRTTTPDDDNGHGTHCAGIVGAVDNGIGVIGVAAGATVVPVKVLNRRGSGTYDAIIAGVDFVADNGKSGDVANMSLGGGFSQSLNDAVIAAAETGVRFTLAAGNESTDANLKSPASANGANIFTISAMAVGDLWASYSNYGNPPVDYCEPGSSIYSTYKGGAYATMSGTSMAAPHAAGILLLGNMSTDGHVIGDPDGYDDPIGVH